MPYSHHHDPKQKWQQQYLTTKNHILPFINQHYSLPKQANILEIGCGEGGVLKAFSEAGYICYGIDIAANRIEHAKQLLAKEVAQKAITFYAGDVYDTKLIEHLHGQIDLIILKDAIEHIPEQEKILAVLHQFLRQDGCVFLAFPPWFNPFGGHQQLAGTFLRFVPWFHILPKPAYKTILKLCGETETQIRVLLEIYDTRLSIRRFERILSNTNWRILKRAFFLFNPIYEYKFGIKGRKQNRLLAAIPFVRDFFSTSVYYLIR